MNYYNIGRTNKIDVIGFYPQTELSDIYNVDADNSYRKVAAESFPNFEPKYGLVLNSKSKETDLLDSAGLTVGFIVSEKLKGILKEFALPPYRFYSVDVIGAKQRYFWFHHIAEIQKYIDYEKTIIEVYKNRAPFEVQETLLFKSEGDIMNFKRALPYNKAIRFKAIQLRQDFPNYDIFEIKGAQYFTLISESLKNELFEQNITGIEIMEYDKIKCTTVKGL